jgi:hypothetical protein
METLSFKSHNNEKNQSINKKDITSRNLFILATSFETS